jgi:hypothetical protein
MHETFTKRKLSGVCQKMNHIQWKRKWRSTKKQSAPAPLANYAPFEYSIFVSIQRTGKGWRGGYLK